MNNMIKERTLLTFFMVACGIMLNIDICFIFPFWIDSHLCIWAIWCILSMFFLGYLAFNLIHPYKKREDNETRRSDKRTKN